MRRPADLATDVGRLSSKCGPGKYFVNSEPVVAELRRSAIDAETNNGWRACGLFLLQCSAYIRHARSKRGIADWETGRPRRPSPLHSDELVRPYRLIVSAVKDKRI